MTISSTPPHPAADPSSPHVELITHPRPKPPGALAASMAFAWRAAVRIKNVPQELVVLVTFPIIFTLLFTYLFGGAIAGSTGDYLQFFLPGVVVMNVVMMTPESGIALNKEISTGLFDRFRTLPMWQPSALVGALFGDAIRYTITSTVVVLFGLLLGFRPGGGVLGVVLAILLLQVFAFSLAWIWILLGLVIKTGSALQMLSTMIQFPLMFASNLFVSPETMPGWLRAFVEVNPISQAVTAVRGLMYGTITAAQIGWVAVACGALLIVFAPLAMVRYLRRDQN